MDGSWDQVDRLGAWFADPQTAAIALEALGSDDDPLARFLAVIDPDLPAAPEHPPLP